MRARHILSSLTLPMLMLAAPPTAAQIPPELQAFDEQLPGSLINDPRDIVWPTQGSALDVKGVQNADIPGGGAARRYEVKTKGPELWSSQTHVPLLAPHSAYIRLQQLPQPRAPFAEVGADAEGGP